MLPTRELFDSLTVRIGLSSEDLATAVEVLQECLEAVTACSAGMLTGPDAAHLAPAIARDLDCTDVAEATRRVLTRGTGPDSALVSAQLEACLLACERSHELCSQHAAHHEHCRICSEATQRCADTCRQLLTALHT